MIIEVPLGPPEPYDGAARVQAAVDWLVADIRRLIDRMQHPSPVEARRWKRQRGAERYRRRYERRGRQRHGR